MPYQDEFGNAPAGVRRSPLTPTQKLLGAVLVFGMFLPGLVLLTMGTRLMRSDWQLLGMDKDQVSLLGILLFFLSLGGVFLLRKLSPATPALDPQVLARVQGSIQRRAQWRLHWGLFLVCALVLSFPLYAGLLALRPSIVWLGSLNEAGLERVAIILGAAMAACGYGLFSLLRPARVVDDAIPPRPAQSDPSQWRRPE